MCVWAGGLTLNEIEDKNLKRGAKNHLEEADCTQKQLHLLQQLLVATKEKCWLADIPETTWIQNF